MKRFGKCLLSLMLIVSFLCADIGTGAGSATTAYADEKKDSIYLLTKQYSNGKITPVGRLKGYDECYYGKKLKITENLKGHLALANTLTFSNQTKFSKLPNGYDSKKLLEWGKYPGLNIDILHKYGFTGKGSVIAYIDQPVEYKKQQEYKRAKIHYKNNSENSSSLHGPAVLSLLAGKNTGTAPDSEIYYYAHAAWKGDQKTHAECLYQIIEQNKKLPKDKKITMVGFSDNIDETEKNPEAFRKAVKACEASGVMVWFCGEYNSAGFIPNSDKNSFENLTTDHWVTQKKLDKDELVWVPAAGRTSAYEEGLNSYIYWSEGGLSWTMPYMLGLYGIVKKIDPSLTQKEIREMVVSSAYTNTAGLRIVDPLEFVCCALDRVGRKSTATKMRNEVKNRNKYTYALMNTSKMSEEDVRIVSNYLSTITDSSVVIADTSELKDAASIYDAIKKDHKNRGGKIAGVQIFGTPDMVPTFLVSYKVKMEKEIDDSGTVETDYFYSNLDNRSDKLNESYSVYEQFKNKENIDLIPDWPVARLPLEKGEFATYFKRYQSFEAATGLKRQTLVNFSNPIFAQKDHIDDMGQFLIRMKKEQKLKIDYRLYGNLNGNYPVSTKVLGNFTAANMSKENKKAISEFLVNSHGQEKNIDQAIFVNGKEVRKSFINTETINKKLNSNPYYLDTWTCNNGYNMKNNLITTALNGKCVGAFAATTIISNNGVNNKASVKQMKKSNFYYFYYTYLKTLGEGKSRSTSFYSAQKAYASALLAESKKKIDYGANYQFNMYNLLAYHNFGVLSANPAVASMYEIKNNISLSDAVDEGEDTEDDSMVPTTNKKVTKGNPVSDYTKAEIIYRDLSSVAEGNNAYYQKLDNGYYRFKVEVTVRKKSTDFFAFNPPDGTLFMIHLGSYKKGKQTIVWDIKANKIKNIDTISISYPENSNEYSVFAFSIKIDEIDQTKQ